MAGKSFVRSRAAIGRPKSEKIARLKGAVDMATQSTVKSAHSFNTAELGQHTLQRRAIEAAIWGMPIVSVEAMRQAFFRDAGAKYGDIVYLSQPSDWKFLCTTPNNSTRYV